MLGPTQHAPICLAFVSENPWSCSGRLSVLEQSISAQVVTTLNESRPAEVVAVLLTVDATPVHTTQFADGRSASIEDLVSSVISGRVVAVLYEWRICFRSGSCWVPQPWTAAVWCVAVSSRRTGDVYDEEVSGADVDSVQWVIHVPVMSGADISMLGRTRLLDSEKLEDNCSNAAWRVPGNVTRDTRHRRHLPITKQGSASQNMCNPSHERPTINTYQHRQHEWLSCRATRHQCFQKRCGALAL